MTERYGETRSYFLWLILGICTFGICLAIYYYMNFADLDGHFKRLGMHDGAPSTEASALLMTLVCCCIPYVGSAIAMYQKYSILHDHVEASGGTRNIPDGLEAVLINLLLSWVSLGIIFIYFEWKWQDVFNEHIRWHASRGAKQVPTR